MEINPEQLKVCACGKPLKEGEGGFLGVSIVNGEPVTRVISDECFQGYLHRFIHQHEEQHPQQQLTPEQAQAIAQKAMATALQNKGHGG